MAYPKISLSRDVDPNSSKTKAAQILGKSGGQARAVALTPTQREAIARLGGEAKAAHQRKSVKKK